MMGSATVNNLGSEQRTTLVSHNAHLPSSDDYKALENWLSNEGANLSNITFCQSNESEGCGVYARTTLHPSDRVAFLPEHLILSETTALQSCIGQYALDYNDTLLAEQYPRDHLCTKTVLWLYIVYECFERGSKSKWHPYFKALPKSFDTPFYWTEDELAMLKGTNLWYVVHEKKEELQRDFAMAYAVLKDVVDEHGQPLWTKDEHNLCFDNFLWARTVCSSRAFPSNIGVSVQDRTTQQDVNDNMNVISDTHQPVVMKVIDVGSRKYQPCKCYLALWPLFDMLNHRRGSRMTWDATIDNGVWFITNETIEAGCEVYNNYGPKGNDELLLSYGFCLDTTNNPDDYYPIKLNLTQDPLYERKQKLLVAAQLVIYKNLYLLRFPSTFPSVDTSTILPPELLQTMRVFCLTECELTDMENHLSESLEKLHNSQPLSLRSELQMLSTLFQLLLCKQDTISTQSSILSTTTSDCQQTRSYMASIYKREQAALLAYATKMARARFSSCFKAAYQDGLIVLIEEDILQSSDFWEEVADLTEYLFENNRTWEQDQLIILWLALWLRNNGDILEKYDAILNNVKMKEICWPDDEGELFDLNETVTDLTASGLLGAGKLLPDETLYRIACNLYFVQRLALDPRVIDSDSAESDDHQSSDEDLEPTIEIICLSMI